ncbi:MAG: energy-coupling factor transporter ATPase [Candidatus Onthovivens sp.]|nr:energy-coupling factor transporter ATPase [Candidatus Onthovivens sp.]
MSIKVNNVSYLYNKKENLDKAALKEISLTIKDKDFVTIVGKTGSGKSTLVQTFNALILPTFGYNEIEEFYITEDKKLKKELLKNKDKTIRKENKRYSKLKKKVGMVFQFPEYQLFSETVLKDVMFGPKNFGFSEEEAKERAIKALQDVGIPESYFDKSPFELSGGEKRRVAIAGIIASEPDILILDEPTAGLDPKGKKEILELIAAYHKTGKTVIVVTHDMDIVLEYSEKVIVLNNGKLIDILSPDELFKKENLEELSLEMPNLIKFKYQLKYWGFAGFLENINDFDSLIEAIVKEKGEQK